MVEFFRKYPALMLLMVCLLMLLPHLGSVQTNIMESRNFITAREMVQDGNWIFTTINGEPRYEKPPLPTWITAGFGAVFGFENLFWLRLPAVLVTLMLVFYFFRIADLLNLKREQAYAASLILITSFYIFFAGRDNQWDIWCHAFMTGSIFYSLRYFTSSTLRTHDRPGKRFTAGDILLSGFFFGLSFLSKGPVSVYALWLPFMIALFVAGFAKRTMMIKGLVMILIVGLIIGFSWPLYIRFFDEAGVTKAVSTEAKRWGDYNTKPLWYYWNFFLQSGIWALPTLIAVLFPFMRRRAGNLSAYRMSFVWAVGAVLLLSFIPEKKARYLLPTLIPLALTTSFYIQYLIDHGKELTSKTERTFHQIVTGLPGLAGFFAAGIIGRQLVLHRMDLSVYYLLSIGLGLLGFAVFWSACYRKFRAGFYWTVLMMCSLMLLIPMSKFYYKNRDYASPKELHRLEKEKEIATFEADPFVPEIVFEYGSKIPRAYDIAAEVRKAGKPIGLLMHPGNEKLFLPDAVFKAELIGRVDVNYRPKEQKGHNIRLEKNYWMVSLK